MNTLKNHSAELLLGDFLCLTLQSNTSLQKTMKFTWIQTYKAIAQKLLLYEDRQKELICILKKIGVERFTDYGVDGAFELEEIDPFTFFSYLNKYKDDRRIELLQKIYMEFSLSNAVEFPVDVHGIPTTHPMKVWLFPYKIDRSSSDISNLWQLFKQTISKNIDNKLLQEVLKIRSVGRSKLSICWYYTDSEHYLPLDSQTTKYLRKRNQKYTFNTFQEYDDLRIKGLEKIKKHPYEISFLAWKDEEDIVTSVEDIIFRLNDTLTMGPERSGSEFYYRGEANKEFELKPSIYRNNRIDKEHIIFKEMESAFPSEFDVCKCTFDKLVKMQHYELPTRLLDITANPLVALYFTCKDDNHKNADGVLYRFEIPHKAIKYSDGDAISVVSNIARRPNDFEIETIKHITNVDDFNAEGTIPYLLHEIRCSEKPHFLSVIDREDIESVFFVKPKLNNARIIKQEGAFFIFGIQGKKSQCPIIEFDYVKYIIPSSSKKKIIDQLEALGFNESTLFPEMPRVAKHLKDKYCEE